MGKLPPLLIFRGCSTHVLLCGTRMCFDYVNRTSYCILLCTDRYEVRVHTYTQLGVHYRYNKSSTMYVGCRVYKWYIRWFEPSSLKEYVWSSSVWFACQNDPSFNFFVSFRRVPALLCICAYTLCTVDTLPVLSDTYRYSTSYIGLHSIWYMCTAVSTNASMTRRQVPGRAREPPQTSHQPGSCTEHPSGVWVWMVVHTPLDAAKSFFCYLAT